MIENDKYFRIMNLVRFFDETYYIFQFVAISVVAEK